MANAVNSYILLSALWIAWCALHSILASNEAKDFAKKHFGNLHGSYRLLYNLFAIYSFYLVFRFQKTLWNGFLFEPPEYILLLSLAVIAIAFAIFLKASINYDSLDFSGIRQFLEYIKAKKSQKPRLVTTGILGIIRHPIYLSAIMLMWSLWLFMPNVANLVSVAILTVYIRLGIILEEKKLVIEFGGRYREYQRRVPMIIPYLRFKKKA